jgi:hypothetical protein
VQWSLVRNEQGDDVTMYFLASSDIAAAASEVLQSS